MRFRAVFRLLLEHPSPTLMAGAQGSDEAPGGALSFPEPSASLGPVICASLLPGKLVSMNRGNRGGLIHRSGLLFSVRLVLPI